MRPSLAGTEWVGLGGARTPLALEPRPQDAEKTAMEHGDTATPCGPAGLSACLDTRHS